MLPPSHTRSPHRPKGMASANLGKSPYSPLRRRVFMKPAAAPTMSPTLLSEVESGGELSKRFRDSSSGSITQKSNASITLRLRECLEDDQPTDEHMGKVLILPNTASWLDFEQQVRKKIPSSGPIHASVGNVDVSGISDLLCATPGSDIFITTSTHEGIPLKLHFVAEKDELPSFITLVREIPQMTATSIILSVNSRWTWEELSNAVRRKLDLADQCRFELHREGDGGIIESMADLSMISGGSRIFVRQQVVDTPSTWIVPSSSTTAVSSLAESSLELSGPRGDTNEQIVRFQTQKVASSISAKAPWVSFIVSPPGCRVHALCEKIADQSGYVCLDMNDLVRNEIASGSDLGAQLLQDMQATGDAPPHLLVAVLDRAFRNRGGDAPRRFLLHGFPQNMHQVREYRSKFESDCQKIFCINVKAADALVACVNEVIDVAPGGANRGGCVAFQRKTRCRQRVKDYFAAFEEVAAEYRKAGKLHDVYADGKALFLSMAKKRILGVDPSLLMQITRSLTPQPVTMEERMHKTRKATAAAPIQTALPRLVDQPRQNVATSMPAAANSVRNQGQDKSGSENTSAQTLRERRHKMRRHNYRRRPRSEKKQDQSSTGAISSHRHTRGAPTRMPVYVQGKDKVIPAVAMPTRPSPEGRSESVLLQWLQSLGVPSLHDLTRTSSRWRRDFANGYHLAAILNLYFPQEVNMGFFRHAVSHAAKKENWFRLSEFFRRKRIRVSSAMLEAISQSRPGFIIELLKKIYEFLVRQQLIQPIAEPVGRLRPEVSERPVGQKHVHWQVSEDHLAPPLEAPAEDYSTFNSERISQKSMPISPYEGGRHAPHAFSEQNYNGSVQYRAEGEFPNHMMQSPLSHHVPSPEHLSESFLQPITFDD